jgi:hypothetical protein
MGYKNGDGFVNKLCQWKCGFKDSNPSRSDSAIEMKGITRCKLTIIIESAVCKKFLGQIVSYPAGLYIYNSHSLECYVVI